MVGVVGLFVGFGLGLVLCCMRRLPKEEMVD